MTRQAASRSGRVIAPVEEVKVCRVKDVYERDALLLLAEYIANNALGWLQAASPQADIKQGSYADTGKQ